VITILTDDQVIIRFSPDQPRDDHGRFGEGSGEVGAGGRPSDVAADKYGNTRENGQWFDDDGGHMTDAYVEKYGLPVTYSQFAHDRGNAYEVVLSSNGDYSIGYTRDGGPSQALYTRDAADVRISGLSASDVNRIADDTEHAMDASTVGRPVDQAGEDVAGESFGVGQTWNTAGGLTLTSAPNGAVTVSGLKPTGKDETFSEGEAGDMVSSLRSMTEPFATEMRASIATRILTDDQVIIRFSPDQPRDDHGRFGEGEGGAAAAGSGSGVRDSLRQATTTDELNAAASDEARRITGRDIPFDMAGSDVQIAKEHSEGVLRVLEKYPEAGILRVRTENTAGTDPSGGTPYARISNDDVVFSREYASDPSGYRASLANAESIGWYAPGHASPMAIGVHEAGHLTGPAWETGPRAGGIAFTAAHAAGHGQSEDAAVGYVASKLGKYATTGGEELTAIGFTDVMLHGSDASALAHDLYDMNDTEYHRVIGH
jgi:hypothetical protein